MAERMELRQCVGIKAVVQAVGVSSLHAIVNESNAVLSLRVPNVLALEPPEGGLRREPDLAIMSSLTYDLMM
jgi:hypothetical protein